MTDETPTKQHKLCEAARTEAGAEGALLVLLTDNDGGAQVTFAWDGSNRCHSIMPQVLRSIADAMEQGATATPTETH